MILVVSDLAGTGGPVGAGQPAGIDLVRSVVRRAGELLEDGEVGEARAVVREALDAGGCRADLLWTLADIEFAGGDLVAGSDCLAEALDASGGEPAAAARLVRGLRCNGLWREALLAVEAFPADMRSDRLVRAEAGAFYRGCGCPAHATAGYGPRRGLPRRAREIGR